METNAISEAIWQGFEKQLRTYVRSRVDPQCVDDVVGDGLAASLHSGLSSASDESNAGKGTPAYNLETGAASRGRLAQR